MKQLLIFCLALVVTYSEANPTDPLVVSTVNGKVKGEIIECDDGVKVKEWASIPFAKPPVNELRFKRTLPMSNWDDVLDVTGIPNTCIQDPNFAGSFLMPNFTDWFGNSTFSEDCLYLGITTPLETPKDAAVIVYFYGAGNSYGSISMFDSRRHRFASDGNVIIVAANYRVSAFGYLYSGDDNAPGNAGIYDQIEALNWVQANIRNFGGDPNKVTIAGHYSGGGMTGMVLMSSKYTHLYQQGILLSGTPNNAFWVHTKEQENYNFQNFAKWTGCYDEKYSTAEIVDCLRSKPASDLIKFTYLGMFAPIPDENLGIKSRDDIFDGFPDGSNKRIIIGRTKDEASFSTVMINPEITDLYENKLLNESYFRSKMESFMSSWPKEFVELVIYNYMPWEDLDNSDAYRDALVRFLSDTLFDCDSEMFSEVASSNNWSVYSYTFSYKFKLPDETFLRKWPGVADGADLTFLFGESLTTDEEKKVGTELIKRFANFAKTGDPNYDSNLDKWETFDMRNRGFMNITNEFSYIQNGNKNKNCFLFEKFLPIMKKMVMCEHK